MYYILFAVRGLSLCAGEQPRLVLPRYILAHEIHTADALFLHCLNAFAPSRRHGWLGVQRITKRLKRGWDNFFSCSCLTALTDPFWVQLSKTYKPFSSPLYKMVERGRKKHFATRSPCCGSRADIDFRQVLPPKKVVSSLPSHVGLAFSHAYLPN